MVDRPAGLQAGRNAPRSRGGWRQTCRISLTTPENAAIWARAMQVSERELWQAVQEAGDRAVDVARYLGRDF